MISKNSILNSLEKDKGIIDSQIGHTAAVMILALENHDLEIVFTKRSGNVNSHKHEVAFPGGAVEEGDESYFAAAKRETCEEIHLCSDTIEFLGNLEPLKTHYGTTIFPFVGSIKKEEFLKAQPNEEVDEVFTIPLSWLMDDANWSMQDFLSRNGTRHDVIVYEKYKGNTVWGISATILHEFLELIKK